MSERVVAAPTLHAVASPVDRYVAPLRKEAAKDPLLSVAEALQRVNPAINDYLTNRHTEYVKSETAAGANTEAGLDPSVGLAQNRKDWKSVVDAQRKIDARDGTDAADRLAAASPHFQRGMYKARAQRLGRGFNDHLAMLYAKNPEIEVGGETISLHDVDDPSVFQQWAAGVATEYSENLGVSSLDPVVLNEVYTPLVTQAQDTIQGSHTSLRLDRYQTEYKDELSANVGVTMSSATGNSDVQTFIGKLAGSESAGNYNSVNTLGYTGLLQFGQPRLDDYNNAHGTSYKLKDLIDNQQLQDALNIWHVGDIDRVIDENGFLNRGYSRDGLRAVAHLGGIGGMEKFVEARGGYNPKDDYGTSLMDYYNKFSGPSTDIQHMMDEAIADGVAPKDVNKTIVNSIIADAVAKRDAAGLHVLNNLDTGNGPLGNIGWVKATVSKAHDQITDLNWQKEQRDYTVQERERTEQARDLTQQVFRQMQEAPSDDYSEVLKTVTDAGHPELANKLANFQQNLLKNGSTVITDHEFYAELRSNISTANTDEERQKLRMGILESAGTRLSFSNVETLMDAIEGRERNRSLMDDRAVTNIIDGGARTVKSRFGTKDFLGNAVGADEYVFTFRAEIEDDLYEWAEANPDASKREVKTALRGFIKDALNSTEWQNPEAEQKAPTVGLNPQQNRAEPAQAPAITAPVTDPQALAEFLGDPTKSLSKVDFTKATPEQINLINQAATAYGMTAQEFIQKYGAQ
ncbi:hypothetical protein ACQU0X_08515 [Pseudovibrio ascidiaceicola]|uniref:hypothetical protein n=1 Tax=Pseudovibrio ascidiaceicola TaxID=285279 RepID=UPI003D367E12